MNLSHYMYMCVGLDVPLQCSPWWNQWRSQTPLVGTQAVSVARPDGEWTWTGPASTVTLEKKINKMEGVKSQEFTPTTYLHQSEWWRDLALHPTSSERFSLPLQQIESISMKHTYCRLRNLVAGASHEWKYMNSSSDYTRLKCMWHVLENKI